MTREYTDEELLEALAASVDAGTYWRFNSGDKADS